MDEDGHMLSPLQLLDLSACNHNNGYIERRILLPDLLDGIHFQLYNRVNRQLPSKIVSFVNYPLKLTKLQLPPEISQR